MEQKISKQTKNTVSNALDPMWGIVGNLPWESPACTCAILLYNVGVPTQGNLRVHGKKKSQLTGAAGGLLSPGDAK